MSPDSTASSSRGKSRKPQKPGKPNPKYPLFAHQNGQWAKKIKGKLHYFGLWNDPVGALKKYEHEKEALEAGRDPEEQTGDLTVKELCNKYLVARQPDVDSGELKKRTWEDYHQAGKLCIEHFGKDRAVKKIRPEDFRGFRTKLSQKWKSLTTLNNVIQRVRVIFKFAFDDGLIDTPVRYGQGFKRPSQKTRRIERAKKGEKLFGADEIRKLIGAASPAMQAMIYLGINAGLGNADCGHLPSNAIDWEKSILDFPRPKTGIPRRAALWPETILAIRDAIAIRPNPKDPANDGLVFITKYGLSWAKETADQTLAKEFGKLLRTLGINGRVGLGFYTLRHTFRTVADESKDQPCVDHIMGHEVPGMSSIYRERISDERLKAVSDYVRNWLFGEDKANTTDR